MYGIRALLPRLVAFAMLATHVFSQLLEFETSMHTGVAEKGTSGMLLKTSKIALHLYRSQLFQNSMPLSTTSTTTLLWESYPQPARCLNALHYTGT